MDTKKFRVIITGAIMTIPGRGLQGVTQYGVRQPGCTFRSIKECRRDRHRYCDDLRTLHRAMQVATYYGGCLNRELIFQETITANPAPKKRKR